MPEIPFPRIAIVGVGLIGGSIALASRARNLCRSIIGVGRNPDRLNEAVARQVIDSAVLSIDSLEDVDLVIVCTPVDRIVENVAAILKATPRETLITDAGSVKSGICEQVLELDGGKERFIGSHPLAGSHQSGFEHATADLFVNRKCVVTPVGETSPELTETLTQFWKSLGMLVHTATPRDHDRILAMVSHLPHLVASALAGIVPESALVFGATGFRDTTRVAAGDADLWTAIFNDNSDQICAATSDMIQRLSEFRAALENDDRHAIQSLLQAGRENRNEFERLQQNSLKDTKQKSSPKKGPS
ncbi:prephenate dehydrogenase [Thalassoglobus neptunius]|uniref:prephenate dehydrogenase n=1 Tax=Thalassoglobus neptunius TaxID=1938619 RepID=UPI0018D205F9|nr:prephenate dehydrogenase [Thalassoglobus neptunius]